LDAESRELATDEGHARYFDIENGELVSIQIDLGEG